MKTKIIFVILWIIVGSHLNLFGQSFNKKAVMKRQNNIKIPKISFFLVIQVYILLFPSCNGYFPCREKYYRFSEVTERYFQYFDEGNSWSYINLDNTKKDSLYVKNIQSGPIVFERYCEYWDYRYMLLFSSFLNSDTVFCEYTTSPFSTFSLAGKYPDSLEEWKYSFYALKNDTLHVAISQTAKSMYETLDNMTLPNGKTYSDVINCNNRFWIAPNIGIIQFISYDGKDMFYLDKFYKK
jgi:hypothetical protein